MNKQNELSSKDGRLKIQIVGWEEPNNGRMLLKVKVTLDENEINSRLFDSNWNFINFEIKHLSISDDSANFYYIPVEGKSKLIRKSDSKVIALKYQGLSTARFIGNQFSKKYLIETFRDEISITSLNNFSNATVHPNEGEIIYNCEFIDDDSIRIDTYQVENNQRIERSTTRAIPNKGFIAKLKDWFS